MLFAPVKTGVILSVFAIISCFSIAEAVPEQDYHIYVKRAERNFNIIYKKGGLGLLNQYVDRCYGDSIGKKTFDGDRESHSLSEKETPGFKVCYLVDSLAYALDRKRRHL
ncbi:hypothetical protein PT283_08170, partial [Acetobacteraceae bacterium ESL0697]|nr:hypothetical protein [Acetobacteraceae bacterium ESL0697]